jgi:hypothetical protein
MRGKLKVYRIAMEGVYDLQSDVHWYELTFNPT